MGAHTQAVGIGDSWTRYLAEVGRVALLEPDEVRELAHRVEALLREVSPTIFPEATAAELFALPEQPPFGQVGIDVFFYASCRPTR